MVGEKYEDIEDVETVEDNSGDREDVEIVDENNEDIEDVEIVDPVTTAYLTVRLAAVSMMLGLPGTLGVAVLVTGEDGVKGDTSATCDRHDGDL